MVDGFSQLGRDEKSSKTFRSPLQIWGEGLTAFVTYELPNVMGDGNIGEGLTAFVTYELPNVMGVVM